MAREIFGSEALGKDIDKLYEVMNDGSDLACVLIGASYLDAALASLLKHHFIRGKTSDKLLERGGALSDFYNRASVSYCLSLISKHDFKNLQKIGQIRNKVAHEHLMLDFSDSGIKKLVDELSLPNIEPPEGLKFLQPKSIGPRDKFNFIVLMTAYRLLLDGVSKEKTRNLSETGK